MIITMMLPMLLIMILDIEQGDTAKNEKAYICHSMFTTSYCSLNRSSVKVIKTVYNGGNFNR